MGPHRTDFGEDMSKPSQDAGSDKDVARSFELYLRDQRKRSTRGFWVAFTPVFVYPIYSILIALFQSSTHSSAANDAFYKDSYYYEAYLRGDMNIDLSEFVQATMTTSLLLAIIWIFVILTLRRSIGMWFVKQRVRVLWLRRFHSERWSKFRPSSVFDRLSRYGISVLTIEDSKVNSSKTRRAILSLKIFSALVLLPLMALYLATPVLVMFSFPTCPNYSCGIDDLGAAPGTLGVIAFGAAVIGAYLVARILSFLWFLLRRARSSDDKKLKRRLQDGGYSRGIELFKISDDFWQEAVLMALEKVDAVVIDISELNENIAWELQRTKDKLSGPNIILIGTGEPKFDPKMDRASVDWVSDFIEQAGPLKTRIAYPERGYAYGENNIFEMDLVQILFSSNLDRFTRAPEKTGRKGPGDVPKSPSAPLSKRLSVTAIYGVVGASLGATYGLFSREVGEQLYTALLSGIVPGAIMGLFISWYLIPFFDDPENDDPSAKG